MLYAVWMTLLKGTGIYILALFLVRRMGMKLIAQMNSLDFVMVVSMGSMIAYAIIDKHHAIASATTALILFASLTMLSGYISLKSPAFRKLIHSEPIVLMEKGEIVKDNMKKMRMSLTELKTKLRDNDVFHMADVEFAIMETDGNVSVLLKPDKKPITPGDLQMQTGSSSIEKDIILDGTVMDEQLTSAGLTREWLMAELQKQGIADPAEVFYAGVDEKQKLYVSKGSVRDQA
ncbi:DUF421 domain-containing protein [Ectobacillus ponti]|uniref:DUF421 domain-containing protein n=1 Tax=Ectobacillus ponti TaxID=2961894 RepID=A0AA41X5X8_9BACI|nr:DUF421 domain-containing protein [Ectobacillus ponti]MCP8967773.1 DUF421 domain-containing protein [Ectobacillus ponti]